MKITTMKKYTKTTSELAEEHAAMRAYKRKQIEALIGNEVCRACGGTGFDEKEWTCAVCDGFGVVYEGE